MIIHKRLRLTRLALALSAALAVTQPALAQNTTSALSGRAYTAQGAPAANATVRIIHVESGSASEVKADAEGRYAARGLRPGGPYTVVITQNGQSQTKENVFLTLAETTNLDLSLAGEMAGTVTTRVYVAVVTLLAGMVACHALALTVVLTSISSDPPLEIVASDCVGSTPFSV